MIAKRVDVGINESKVFTTTSSATIFQVTIKFFENKTFYVEKQGKIKKLDCHLQ
jgi:hypothetical protein